MFSKIIKDGDLVVLWHKDTMLGVFKVLNVDEFKLICPSVKLKESLNIIDFAIGMSIIERVKTISQNMDKDND